MSHILKNIEDIEDFIRGVTYFGTGGGGGPEEGREYLASCMEEGLEIGFTRVLRKYLMICGAVQHSVWVRLPLVLIKRLDKVLRNSLLFPKSYFKNITQKLIF